MSKIKVDDLTHLCSTSDIAVGDVIQVQLPDRKPMAVYNVDGTFFATDDHCTHGAALLSEEGELNGYVIECLWHFGSFDIRTGEVVAMPCTVPLKTYPITVEGDDVYADLTETQGEQ